MTFKAGDWVAYERLNTANLAPEPCTAQIVALSPNGYAALSNQDIYPLKLLSHADPRPEQLHPNGNMGRRR